MENRRRSHYSTSFMPEVRRLAEKVERGVLKRPMAALLPPNPYNIQGGLRAE
jgi:hypothetical protein